MNKNLDKHVFAMKCVLYAGLLSILVTSNFFTLAESYKMDNQQTKTMENKTITPANDLEPMHEQTFHSDTSCKLEVGGDSENMFSHEIMKHKYNFVHLRLNFVDFNVSETKYVINKNDWIWTYKGEKGAHQYLYLPGDFGYLSFGLLWSYTRLEQIQINIYYNKTGECRDLKVGKITTDQLIGEALGGMTSKIAAENDNYNSSYWCYNRRVWLHSWFLYYACKNSVCTFQTFEYSCCKFKINLTKKTRKVECGLEHYHFGELWWMLPIIVGEVCFGFYPLLLTKIGMKVKTLSEKFKKVKRRTISSTFSERDYCYTNDDENDNNHIKYRYFSSKYSNPITFVSTICSPLYGFDLNGPVISRLLRIWIIFLPMTLSTIRVTVDYIYAKDVVTDAVKKGALVGFSSIIAGPSEARQQFLYIFQGPVVALSIYVVFGCMLIVFPRNFETFLDAGFQETHKSHVFLAKMPLKKKERLSGFSVRHLKGYHKLHKLFLAQVFMLLNLDFWRKAVKLFFFRWKDIVFPSITLKLRSMFLAVIASFIILPLYMVFSVIELCLTVIYFVFPVINCFFIILKVFLIHYSDFFKDRGCILKCICGILFLPMLVSFCITWYIYCLLFFDGLWFLSKIAMFTYSGIIAYPKISYGYLVLVFMAIYYLTESINAFGESYRHLLKLSIETCERFQARYHDDSDIALKACIDIRNKYGIKSDLFFAIVDRHLPRRNQVLITILKFTSVITVLTISVELLITFDKLQELSLVSHVFTALFICALPKIIKMMCIGNSTDQKRRRMRQKIYRTVANYVRNIKRNEGDSANDEEIVQLSRSSGYETFHDSVNENHIVEIKL